jgi:hypothetical protein
VTPRRLLYVCDFFDDGRHIIHITFEVERAGGTLGSVEPGADTREIRGVGFVPVDKLPLLGFSERFQQLVRAGFPQAGSYMGLKSNIGL